VLLPVGFAVLVDFEVIELIIEVLVGFGVLVLGFDVVGDEREL
jgi:hypothetical protein